MITSLPADTRIRDATDPAKTAQVGAREQTPAGNVLQVQIGPGDLVSSLPVVMDFEHHQIHEGETFKVIDQQLSLGSTTVKYGIAVATYANTIRAPHMVISVDIYNGSARIDLYAEATFTGGTPLTARNRNRNVTTAAGSSITSGVTSTDGTLIDSFFVAPGKLTAGGGRVGSEWVLKSAKNYRVDVVGLAPNTQAIVGFDWYEDLGV